MLSVSARPSRWFVSLALLVSGLATGCAGTQQVQRDGDWVARVNGESIPAARLSARVDRFIARGSPRPRHELERLCLNDLVIQVLIEQAAERDGVTVDAAAVQAQVDDFVGRWQSPEALHKHLEHRHETLADVARRYGERMLADAVVAARTDVSVSEAELLERYERNRDFYGGGVYLSVSQILFRVAVDATDDQEAKALDKMGSIQAQLAQGADFHALAKAHSEGQSARIGGRTRPFYQHEREAAFWEAAVALEEGEVSEPVRTRDGVVLIRLERRREGTKKTFEEVRSELADGIRSLKISKAKVALIDALRAAATIEERLPVAPK